MNPAPENDVCALSARELARRIACRELSAVEALEAHLARIERRNPELNAVVSLDIEAARRQAEAADIALARGEVRGPLHGVPLTLKDGNDVAGLRTTLGTPPIKTMAESSRVERLIGGTPCRLLHEFDPREIEAMKRQPGKDMIVFGSGSIVSQLTQHGLIDEYQFVVSA